MSSTTFRARSWTRARAAVLALATVGLWGAPAQAYRMIQNNSVGRVTAGSPVTCNSAGGFAHWTDPSIPWRLNTAGQGAGRSTVISNALAAWRNVANASHSLTYVGTTAAGWATDGVNTIQWSAGNGCTGNCLALTALVLQGGQVIVESDITFNAAFTWNANGADHDIQAVATHELGHSLGIHHTQLTSTPRPTMFATYFGTSGRSLEPDDRSALQCSQSQYPFTAGGAPATPVFFNVQSAFCWGMVSLNCPATSGATSYQMQRSSSSTFTSPDLIYNGSNTTKLGNHVYLNGNTWFRVRACNSSGCSGYRNGNDSPHFYGGCF